MASGGAFALPGGTAGPLPEPRVGLCRAGGRGRFRLLHDLPGHLRVGPGQPGRAHPRERRECHGRHGGRAGLSAGGGHGRPHARGGRAAVLPGELPPCGRLRRGGHHAAPRAGCHQRAGDARSRRHPAAHCRPRRGRPHRARGRPVRLQPGALRAVLRRHLGGGGRRAAARGAGAHPRAARVRRAPGRYPARGGAARGGRLRAEPVPLAQRGRGPGCRQLGGAPVRRRAACGAQARLRGFRRQSGARAHDRALYGSGARPAERRDPARLRAGLPFLSGGHDVPPGAGALGRQHRGRRGAGPRRDRLRRGEPDLALFNGSLPDRRDLNAGERRLRRGRRARERALPAPGRLRG